MLATTAPPSKRRTDAAERRQYRADLEERIRILEELEHRRRAQPLAYAELWDQPLPRTSQIRALQSALGCTALLVSGGNGSGKTELLGQLLVAACYGRDHPTAARWLTRNRLDPGILPPYPGRVLASALTSNDSRRVLREKVRRYLPAEGVRWRNEHGDGEAAVQIVGCGTIIFKSNDQGRRAYQGDEYDLIALDEEHDLEVKRECLMRLGRRPWRASWMVLGMTPLLGMTWVYDEFVSSPLPGNRVAWLHGADNPHADQARRAQLLAQYGSHELAARDRGEFTALEGRVYQDWRRDLHVVPAFRPPDTWTRSASIDFGTRNPAAWLLYAHDPSDDVLHVIGEHYASDLTIGQHVERWRTRTAGHPAPAWIAADPEDRGSRLALARDHGIQTVAAQKDVRIGINAVAERLRPDVEGRPHLLVHDCCRNLIREMESYTWTPRSGQRDAPDAPMKRDDHCLDSLRYGVMQLRRGSISAV